MGMFDDIIVPKSYLEGLLTKDQEKLVKHNDYQTKSLENALGQYKVYKQKLFIKEESCWYDAEKRLARYPRKAETQQKVSWSKVNHNGTVNFYTSFSDKDSNSWWAEFNFSFIDGVLDKKELVKFEMQETSEEAKEREKLWKKRHAEMDAFQRTLKYKFFEKVRAVLSRILVWVQRRTIMPSLNSTKADRLRAAKKRRTRPSFWKDF